MSGQADIRKWFLKKPTHDKSNSESKKIPAALPNSEGDVVAEKAAKPYQKESKYFSGVGAGGNGDKAKLKLDKTGTADAAGKRKSGEGVKNSVNEEIVSPKKRRLLVAADGDDSEDLEAQPTRQARQKKGSDVEVKQETPSKSGARGKRNAEEIGELESEVKTPARGRGRGRGRGKSTGLGRDGDSSSGEEDEADDDTFAPPKSGGRGKGKSSQATKEDPTPEKKTPKSGGRGRATTTKKEDDEDKPAAGRGRGRGGGGGGGGGPPPWMQPRGAPPHKGEKEIPKGADDALAGLTFVISGTLDSLEREEAEVLVKSHGGRITSAVSKKTSYLLADEDVGGAKSKKAKELGVKFLTEDGLFAMIIATQPKSEKKKGNKAVEANLSPVKTSAKAQGNQTPNRGAGSIRAASGSPFRSGNSEAERSTRKEEFASKLPKPASGHSTNDTDSWTTKHKPKSTADIIGNPGIVKQMRDWLQNWDATFLHHVSTTGKGKKKAGGSGPSGEKKAILLSGQPGIGKTTTARLVCKELGFNALEVNASDTRSKADSNIRSGMSGSTANTIKEMVNNESITFTERNTPSIKSVLIMDEVDGMSGGDRGGIADLIASIKSSKVPIICICNDKYSQKLKSLSNYCLPLPFRKPTKQQMAKRLLVVAKAEGIQVDEVTLEDIAERTNGDMRMSLNQLQYMTLRTRTLKFADVHSRLLASSKDEDISPFSAADKLMGYDGGRLRMDERIDLSMTDMDLVPLIIQENYLNFVPSSANQDQSGITLMKLAARAASAIADGDVVNVQIRRKQQWQHSQTSAFMSSIIPAALMHGRRMEFEGGRNFNRFPGWLGKNSSYGKKVRLLEDIHIHLLASRACEPTREAIRLGYVPLLAFNLSHPLTHLAKDTAVEQVVKLMDEYSLTQDDYDTIMDICKFKGRKDLLEGVTAAVKTALTRRYKQGAHDRRVRSADLLPALNLPGQKKGPKKPARLKLDVEEKENGDIDDAELSDEEEADGEEEEDGDDSKKIDSLLELNKTSNKSVDINTGKGTNGKQGRSAKTPRKSGEGSSSSKPGPTPGKRKR